MSCHLTSQRRNLILAPARPIDRTFVSIPDRMDGCIITGSKYRKRLKVCQTVINPSILLFKFCKSKCFAKPPQYDKES